MDSEIAMLSPTRVFRGTYEHTITRQGRIILPSRFREVLDDRQCNRVIMVRFPNRLDVFPEDAWQVREEQHRLLDQDDDRVFSYLHYLRANQLEADVDRQGRILVPPRWRTALGLDGNLEAVLMGAQTHFEIWPKPRWEEAYRQWEESFAANRGYLAELHRSQK
ncbi:MAG: hypothetical protein A2V67_13125 [Deltaproteobacteria bacterium RBG_13_61_14]|nr:MAG: hypothetical protein A2V67_13125 [Deltaproteobacteria bacterium RBG_13_61_14]